MTRIVWMTTFAYLATSCARPTGQDAAPAPLSAVQALYGALVHEVFGGDHRTVIHVQSQTITYRALPGDSWLRVRKDTVPAPLPDRLTALSSKSHPVDSRWFPAAVELVPPAKARRIAKEGSGGARVLLVSPIAFTDDSLQALVYYEVRCGDLCGDGGELWFIRTPDGRWVLRQGIKHWMSDSSPRPPRPAAG